MELNEFIEDFGHQISDPKLLIKHFGNSEVYFPIDDPANEIPSGRLDVSPPTQLRMQMADLPVGRMAVFYASRKDERLGKKFGGMPLIRALEMVGKSDEVEGLAIQSEGGGWIAIKK